MFTSGVGEYLKNLLEWSLNACDAITFPGTTFTVFQILLMVLFCNILIKIVHYLFGIEQS